jgi:hypothetical protein
MDNKGNKMINLDQVGCSMTTEYILQLADDYARNEKADYLTGDGSEEYFRDALRAAVEAMAAENENLRRANLVCVDYYNQAVQELEAMKESAARAEQAQKEGA